MKPALRLSVLLTWMCAAACSPPPASSVSLQVEPNPIALHADRLPHGILYDTAEWQVIVTETAGVSATVDVTTQVIDTGAGRAIGQVNNEGSDGPYPLAARQTLRLPQNWLYSRIGAIGEPINPEPAPVLIEVSLRLTDVNGHVSTEELQVPELLPRAPGL